MSHPCLYKAQLATTKNRTTAGSLAVSQIGPRIHMRGLFRLQTVRHLSMPRVDVSNTGEPGFVTAKSFRRPLEAREMPLAISEAFLIPHRNSANLEERDIQFEDKITLRRAISYSFRADPSCLVLLERSCCCRERVLDMLFSY